MRKRLYVDDRAPQDHHGTRPRSEISPYRYRPKGNRRGAFGGGHTHGTTVSLNTKRILEVYGDLRFGMGADTAKKRHAGRYMSMPAVKRPPRSDILSHVAYRLVPCGGLKTTERALPSL